jgi:hypothetical protein
MTASSGLGFPVRVGRGMRPRRSIWSGVVLLAFDDISPSCQADGAWPPRIEHGLPVVGGDEVLNSSFSLHC